MNKSNAQLKSSIGIFRALDVRMSHVEFVADFRDFHASLIAPKSSELKKVLTEVAIKTYSIPLMPRWLFDPVYPLLKKTDFTPWLQFDTKQLSKISCAFDVYEIYEPYFFYSSQIADLACKNKVPLITEIWTSFPEHPSLYCPPYNILVKNVVSKTDLFVLRTKRAHSYLQSFLIPEEKKVTLYHGVNLQRFFPLTKDDAIITILFVGALASHKGLDDLLSVFPLLVEKYPKKLKLVICGDGPMRNEIIKLAHQLPIEYKGFVSNTDLPEIYRESDIYCQPSKDYYFLGVKGGEEFAGYTFMEALASGLPIVATQCGGIPEIVGNENYLIQQANKEQLVNALETYIANPSLRNETGKKNRKRAEQLFDLAKQTQKLETLIKKFAK